MNVIRIHAEVQPVPVATTHEPMRRIHWKAARDYWTVVKQERRSGQPELAATILASARQALMIATAADPFVTVSRLAGDHRMVSLVEACRPENKYGPSYHATCEGCGAEGPSGSTQLEAAQRWNQRPNTRQEAGL